MQQRFALTYSTLWLPWALLRHDIIISIFQINNLVSTKCIVWLQENSCDLYICSITNVICLISCMRASVIGVSPEYPRNLSGYRFGNCFDSSALFRCDIYCSTPALRCLLSHPEPLGIPVHGSHIAQMDTAKSPGYRATEELLRTQATHNNTYTIINNLLEAWTSTPILHFPLYYMYVMDSYIIFFCAYRPKHICVHITYTFLQQLALFMEVQVEERNELRILNHHLA